MQADARGSALASATTVQKFKREVADTMAFLRAKLAALPEDCGRDTQSTESLQRQHILVEQEVAGVASLGANFAATSKTIATESPDFALAVTEVFSLLVVFLNPNISDCLNSGRRWVNLKGFGPSCKPKSVIAMCAWRGPTACMT